MAPSLDAGIPGAAPAEPLVRTNGKRRSGSPVGASRYPILGGVNFEIEQRVPAAPSAVGEALVDERFIAATVDLPKVGGAELLDQRRDGTTVHQRIRYRFTGELSSAVTRVVDRDRLTWVDESDHDLAGHRSQHTIVPDNYRDRLQASYSIILEPDGGDSQTRRVVSGTVKVRMPLVGGRVEKAIVSGLEEYATAEAQLLARWLNGGGG